MNAGNTLCAFGRKDSRETKSFVPLNVKGGICLLLLMPDDEIDLINVQHTESGKTQGLGPKIASKSKQS